MWYKESVSQKKRFLSSYLKAPMDKLSVECAKNWYDPAALSATLRDFYPSVPHCQLLYCFDCRGQQTSSSIYRNHDDPVQLGRDLSARPFFYGLLPYTGMSLSSVYLCERSVEPCITAINAIRCDGDHVGFVAADFHFNNLPKFIPNETATSDWQQFRGDPAIRNSVFSQQRVMSYLDQHIDEILYVITCLFQNYGVFHLQIDFSASRVTIWSIENPYEFNILTVDELLSPELYEKLPRQTYPVEAITASGTLPIVLAQMKSLRQADEMLYLRSAMLNVITGTIGLTFSCDGFHVMSVNEFLQKDLNFWLGQAHTYPNIQKLAS